MKVLFYILSTSEKEGVCSGGRMQCHGCSVWGHVWGGALW